MQRADDGTAAAKLRWYRPTPHKGCGRPKRSSGIPGGMGSSRSFAEHAPLSSSYEKNHLSLGMN
jgi:hypothetical protein